MNLRDCIETETEMTFSGMLHIWEKHVSIGFCAWHPIHFGNYLMQWVICNTNEREEIKKWQRKELNEKTPNAIKSKW